MLHIWRRHGPGCKQTSRHYRRCNCPIWIEGTAEDGRAVQRQSLKTRCWAEAERRKAKLDRSGEPPPLAEAVDLFLADLERRNLSRSVRVKFKRMLGQLLDFAAAQAVVRVSGFTVEHAHAFCSTWTYAPSTARAELERLRQFFRFCLDADWIGRNPARPVRPPKETRRPTLPFSPEEMAQLLGVAKPIEKAFLLVMRYSGLRIGDVARLEKERINAAGELMLYTAKTGQPVRVPLPAAVVDALERFPHKTERYYFWDGQSKPDSIRNSWVDRLARVFKRAKLTGAHSHRLRDTFAVELLNRGVSIEHVSILLGHASIRVTERHYARDKGMRTR